MKEELFEMKKDELVDVNGGALGIVASFVVGGVAGIVVVGGIILICECVKR